MAKNRDLSTQDITWFLDHSENKRLDLDPPYQRRSVWSPKDRRFFVDTILNDYPSPPIFLHKELNANDGSAIYHVVDGKQRLTTIIDFRKGKIRVPDDFEDVTIKGKTWKDLPKEAREQFFNYKVSVEFLPDISSEKVRNIFGRINRNSRQLTPQELRHAKYEGWFITAVEKEAEDPVWKDFGLSTTARAKRMADTQFISELYRVLIKGEIAGFDQDDLDTLYADYEEIDEDAPALIEDEFATKLACVKSYIAEVLKANSSVKDWFKIQMHFYSLWCHIALVPTLPEPAEYAKSYIEFMGEVSKVAAGLSGQGSQSDADEDKPEQHPSLAYARSARGASTDLKPRSMRHEALIQALTPEK